jgi:glycosyltransferase involved in cell wall biosynthesis
MRILYSHRIQSRDGQSVHVEELVAALRDDGHEVLVIGPSFYEQAGFGGESSMVATIRRLLPGFLQELAELAYNIPATRRLARAHRTFHPDLIYERYNLYFLAGAWLRRRTGTPLFLEVNAPIADERTRYSGLKLRRLAHAVERLCWRRADKVLAVTGVLRDIIAAAGTPRDRIEVIPNGVVLPRYRRAALLPAPTPLVLGFVGFVRTWHGLDAVIAAMHADHDLGTLALTIIGDGPARPELEQQATTLGLTDRVRFTGTVPHHDVPGHVATFDIALQPKVVAYASPLKIFDYMAAGCAIVAPDQPNIREILQHEHTALLFDPDDPNAMWQSIRRLATDPALRRTLGEAARAELERCDYTWRGNALRVAALALHGSTALPQPLNAASTASP